MLTDGNAESSSVSDHGVICGGVDRKHGGDTTDGQGTVVDKKASASHNGMIRSEAEQNPAWNRQVSFKFERRNMSSKMRRTDFCKETRDSNNSG